MADRRDAADSEAGQLVRFARGRPTDVGGAGDRGQPRQIDPVVTRHEAEQRLDAALAGDDEDERLDDLAELDTEGGGGLDRGVGRLVEDGHLEGHALAGGGVQDALDRGMDGVGGHGPESSIGPRGRARSAR